MATLDWMIVLGVLVSMISAVTFARSYSRNVVDFLAAGRTAGRYVLTLSQGVSEVGAISIIGWLEMNYVAGFPQSWWGLTMGVVILILTVTGWVDLGPQGRSVDKYASAATFPIAALTVATSPGVRFARRATRLQSPNLTALATPTRAGPRVRAGVGQIGMHRVSRQRLHGEGRNEFARTDRHHHAHIGARILQASNQVRAFIRRNTTAYAE